MKTWASMMFIMFLGLWLVTPLGFIAAAGFTLFASVGSVSLALSQQADNVKSIGGGKSNYDWIKELGS